ncbi:hypothetical protein OLQ22_03400 [Campylobacter jejuni]|nr:hypothetical protein [Campylobacter jejuni]
MHQLLICVILEERNNIVRTHSVKNGQIIEMDEKTFDSQDRLIAYIQSLIKNTQLYYISVFFSDVSQGIFLESIHNTNKQNEMKNIQYLNIENMQIYASLKSIEQYKKIFTGGGVDFIFSPFALLHYCVKKEKILNKDLITLCIYKHSDCIAVVIFKANKVVFGSFFETRMKEFPEIISDDKNEAIEEGLEFSIDEEYDVKELDSMLKDKLEHLEEQQQNEKLEDFGNDMVVCRYIISSIEEFYNNPNYKSNFIDEFVIFDNENISKATLEYIENEIFLTPQVIKVDTLELMNELMRKELKI